MRKNLWRAALLASALALGAAIQPVPGGVSTASQDPPAASRDNLTKAKQLALTQMRAVREEANRRFLALNPDFVGQAPPDISRFLNENPSAKQSFDKIQADAQAQRQDIYDRFAAERTRLESVNAAGGAGKVGYVFVGEVEYDPNKKLEVFNATLWNVITLGFLTGREPSRLEDHEGLIREREKTLRQKFETVQVIYLARDRDLGQALSRQDTGGYVFVSHGASDEPAVMGDGQQLITRDEVRAMMQATRNRYILRVLPPTIAKLHEAVRSADPKAATAARSALAGMSAEDKDLYKYVLSESDKVHQDLSYVEHYSCFSGIEGAQDFADMLLGEDGEYIGYAGVTNSSGAANRPTFGGLTVPPKRFRPKAGRLAPDPDPVGTMRKRKPAGEDAALLAVLQRTTKLVLAVYGSVGTKHTSLFYTKTTVTDDPPPGEAPRLFVATLYPVVWSGSSFSGRLVSDGSGSKPETSTLTVSGSVDTVNRRVTRATASSTYSNAELTHTESVDVADIPLQTEKMGYFTFVAEKEAFRGKIAAYQRVYVRKGESEPLSPQDAKREGVEAGVKYPFQIKEESGLSGFNFNAAGSMIRVSLTPTDLAGNPVKK